MLFLIVVVIRFKIKVKGKMGNKGKVCLVIGIRCQLLSLISLLKKKNLKVKLNKFKNKKLMTSSGILSARDILSMGKFQKMSSKKYKEEEIHLLLLEELFLLLYQQMQLK